jgi:hypothetical protein
MSDAVPVSPSDVVAAEEACEPRASVAADDPSVGLP